MNKLSKTGDNEYTFVLEQYRKLLKGFLLKKETDPIFVGGVPVTLTRDNMIELLDRSYKYTDYKYTATAKVDGTRFLCFITESHPGATNKSVYFIDRSMEIFKLVSKNNIPFKNVSLPRMLLDGEMVFYKNKKAYSMLPQYETEYLTFMVFDILFGPSDLYFTDIFTETEPHFKEAVAMSGPIGGPRWDYNSRYSILKKLFIPSSDNNNLPPLPMNSIDSTFFRFELKNIISIKFFGQSKNVQELVERSFKTNRSSYYDFLNKNTTERKLILINNSLKNTKITFDGIIFTPLDTEYVFMTWSKYKNILYKWKPSSEQTVDFKIAKTGDKVVLSGSSQEYVKCILYFRRFDKKSKVDQYIEWKPGKNEPRFGLVHPDTPDGSICEFFVNMEENVFVFSRLRELKGANALMTIKSILEFVKNPVNINLLSRIITDQPQSNTIKLNALEGLAGVLTKEQKLKLLICLDMVEFIDPLVESEIINFIDAIKEPITMEPLTEEQLKIPYYEDMQREMHSQTVKLLMESPPSKELIVYLGKDLPRNKFENIITMMKIINWKSTEIKEKYYLWDDEEVILRFFPELNDYVHLFTRLIKSRDTTKLNVSRIIGHDIIFTKNTYKYKPKYTSLSTDQTTLIEKIVFSDPNGGINIVCETRIKNFLNQPKVFENNVYIEESGYYSINFENIYNFIKFYLNF